MYVDIVVSLTKYFKRCLYFTALCFELILLHTGIFTELYEQDTILLNRNPLLKSFISAPRSHCGILMSPVRKETTIITLLKWFSHCKGQTITQETFIWVFHKLSLSKKKVMKA